MRWDECINYDARVQCSLPLQLPWKSLTSIIEYYYMWRTMDRYVQQVGLLARPQSHLLLAAASLDHLMVFFFLVPFCSFVV